MMRIRTKDTVIVITGRDKNKKGTVLEIDYQKDRLKVSGVCLVTKHQKARKQGEVSQVKRIESWLNLSNVMLVDQTSGEPCRVRFIRAEDGSKQRVSSKTGKQV